MTKLSPRQQLLFNILERADGRFVRLHAIRDEVTPDMPVRNVRKLVFALRAKGFQIEAGGFGIDSKGYRLVVPA